MTENRTWTAMSYNLPIQPSNARVYVWRKLREMGAVPLRQGVAALPQTSHKINELVKLAERIETMQGEAVLFEMRFVNPKDEQEMWEKFSRSRRKESDELIKKARELIEQLEGEHSAAAQRKLNKIIKDYRKLWGSEQAERQESGLGIWEELSSETSKAAAMVKNLMKF